MFNRFASALKKTSSVLSSSILNFPGLVGRDRTADDEIYEELEEALILADVGATAASKIIEKLKCNPNADDARNALAKIIAERFEKSNLLNDSSRSSPHVVLVVGVNGSGKTTTIAKIARKAIGSGGSVIMAAADTFRAAASEQLEHWANRVGADIVRQKSGSDPAAVAFDAVKAGISRGADLVLVDTAGRLQTKTNLMEELKKIKRVMGKAMLQAPHEILMIMDATTGQNGLSQIRLFNQAVELTGIIVTKIDGTAKGGVLVTAAEKFGIPIKYVGVGEKPDDLIEFDPVAFAEALVGINA